MNPNSYTPGAMKRDSHAALVWLTLATVLWVGIAVAGASAQTGRPTDPAAVVHAFNDALNHGDLPAALAFLGPGCRKEVGPHSLNREVQTCGGDPGQFPGPLSGPPIHIAEANLQTTSPTIAEVDLTLSGGTLPPTPHPITLHATFTVENGLITNVIDLVSPQTEQELAALPPPAPSPVVMPTTGASNPNSNAALFVLSLCCVLAGAVVRRSGGSRRDGRS